MAKGFSPAERSSPTKGRCALAKKIKAVREKLQRRLSGKLFRYTFTFSLALHFGVWGLVGFSPRGAIPEYKPEPKGPPVNVIPAIPENELPQPPTIEPETPRRAPEGLPGEEGVGEIIIATPDKDTDIARIKDADTGRERIGKGERIIVIPQGPDTDRPRSASVDTVEIVDYSKPPMLLKMVKPKYPEIAYSSRVEGDVVLMVYIDERGSVRNAVVQSSPGLPALEEAAKEAAYKCKFSPAEQQGVPVAVWYNLVMEFRL
jgi:protein TonB